jgi:tetratricopeptide (TPR) repeat protein
LGIIERTLTLRRTARTSIARVLALGLALSIAAPSSAFAEPIPIEDPEAKALFEEGVTLYEDGDLEAALVKLDASLAIQRSTEALFTKGQSLNRLGRCREAVPVYKEVLTQVAPGSEAEAAVKNVLVVCAEKMAEEDDAPPVAPVIEADSEADGALTGGGDEVDEPPKKPGKRWYKDPYAPVLIGVGAIGIGVGGYYLGQAADENARQPEQYDEFAAKGDRVRRLQIQGGVILGVGGALLLTGAIRYAVLAARDRRSRTAVAPSFGPRWAGISVAGRF